MRHLSVRRLIAGPAAGLAAAVALTGAAPAFAAADPVVDITLPSATSIALGTPTEVKPVLSADRDVELTGAVMTYELVGDLSGVTMAGSSFDDCVSESATRLVCSTPFEVFVSQDGVAGHLPVELTAGPDAEAGATGTLQATFSADGVAPVSATTAVELSEGVDLVAGESAPVEVAPGDRFDGTLVVTNTSDVVVRGVGVVGFGDYAIQPVARFSNCLYEGPRVSCLFEQNLQPGATYTATLPYRLRPDTAAPTYSAADLLWMTADDYAKFESKPGTPGPGGRLRLVQSAPVAARSGQTDVNPGDNWQSVLVRSTGVQGVDIAALGTRVAGAAGETVTATVGVRNRGPATLDRNRAGEPATAAVVTLPAGTTATTVPAGCSPIEGSDLFGDYLCLTGYRHLRGETVSWSFGLRIDQYIRGAKGSIVANPECECSFYDRDIDRSNDEALIVVNPA